MRADSFRTRIPFNVEMRVTDITAQEHRIQTGIILTFAQHERPNRFEAYTQLAVLFRGKELEDRR